MPDSVPVAAPRSTVPTTSATTITTNLPEFRDVPTARPLSMLHRLGVDDALAAPISYLIVWEGVLGGEDNHRIAVHAAGCRRVNTRTDQAVNSEHSLVRALRSADLFCTMVDSAGVALCPCAEPQKILRENRHVFDRTGEPFSRKGVHSRAVVDILALAVAVGAADGIVPVATSAGPIGVSRSAAGALLVTPPPWSLEIQDHTRCHDRPLTPMPGDAVRLAAPWRSGLLAAGQIGVLGGSFRNRSEPGDRSSSIVFNASSHRDETGVSSSGGPATIHTEWSELRPTGDVARLWVWRWKDGHVGAHNGEDYAVMVPVWEWTPTD
ncbi:hypothetical protein ALI22I_20340 [Saccharothrix sp. ALI-22-I]|uniref:hypothetical protein n=1 Tax=Saccharothrix sp. ALI-22-I TaxID=1933778 RepID=UPI00097C1AF8|nr:hypothetical protein [Saccharothrix sp. ALI-22-I]ONI88090.1 hypothetical protein ALI22I_20340 [Saccharothrix sp. ALI-22-I]